MKKLTEILSEEHQRILEVIKAMDYECDRVSAGGYLDKGFFEKAVDFIQNYADRFHHAKEEEILFEELCKDDVKMHCNPVPQMLIEHEQGRNFVAGIKEGIRFDDTQKIVQNAKGYIGLLQDHIYKEDNILYPMADEALGAEAQRSILKRAEAAEKKKFPGGIEKYLKIAEELKKRVKSYDV